MRVEEDKCTKEFESKLLDFLADAVCSPYHCVEAVVSRFLRPAGFQSLSDTDSACPKTLAELVVNGIYKIQCDGTIVGAKATPDFDPRTGKIIVLGSHTDSPCLTLRPCSVVGSEGFNLLGIQPYGGGLWRTWFDRGLGIAGKLNYLEDSADGGDKPKVLVSELVTIQEAICYIPSLCIHLMNRAECESFPLDKDQHLRPILSIDAPTKKPAPPKGAAPSEDNGVSAGVEGDSSLITTSCLDPDLGDLLIEKAVKQRGSKPGRRQLLASQLSLFDCQKPCVGGLKRDFLESPGLDNKSSVFANFHALCEPRASEAKNRLFIAVAFDHEEVGSRSTHGAMSVFFNRFLTHLISSLTAVKVSDGNEGGVKSLGLSAAVPPGLLERSVVVSCDAAHSVHPNYASRHQPQNKPVMSRGVAVKVHVNQHYGTTANLHARTQQIALQEKIPLQIFTANNMSACGTTIGPITAAATGIPTIDVGVPIFAMHSVRELGCTTDIQNLARLSAAYYNHF